MRAPRQPLLLALLLLLGAAGPGRARALSRDPADPRALLRLLAELLRELSDFPAGESKRLQLLAAPELAPGGKGAAGSETEHEEQRVGERVPAAWAEGQGDSADRGREGEGVDGEARREPGSWAGARDLGIKRRCVPPGSVDHGAEQIVPRDLRMKDKFLKHLTGPLYFSPKCSKHFHRLYHNTRDCTIPAYYKRCARLLTRLAVSPMCMEG
ncbi:ALK and LTK ligand 2 [Ctenodactylus gundi]